MADALAFDAVSAALICNTLGALLRAYTPAKTFGANQGPRAVQCDAAQPQLLSPSNDKRIGVAFQCPTGVSGFMGDRRSVTNALGGGGQYGMLIPAGGGWVFGPEYTGDVWLILTVGLSPATITVVELIAGS